jgi:hypothetical protein
MPRSVKRKVSRKRIPKYNTKKRKLTKKIGSQKGGIGFKTKPEKPSKPVKGKKYLPSNKSELQKVFSYFKNSKPLINYYKMLNSNDPNIKKIVNSLKDKSKKIQQLNRVFFNYKIKQSEKLKYLNITENLNVSKGNMLNFVNRDKFKEVTKINSNNKNLVKKLFETDYIELRLNKNHKVFLELNTNKLKDNQILDNLGLAMYKIDKLSKTPYKFPQFKRQIYKFLNNIKSKNDLNVIKNYLETKINKVEIKNIINYIENKKKNYENPVTLNYEQGTETSTRENS